MHIQDKCACILFSAATALAVYSREYHMAAFGAGILLTALADMIIEAVRGKED